VTSSSSSSFFSWWRSSTSGCRSGRWIDLGPDPPCGLPLDDPLLDRTLVAGALGDDDGLTLLGQRAPLGVEQRRSFEVAGGMRGVDRDQLTERLHRRSLRGQDRLEVAARVVVVLLDELEQQVLFARDVVVDAALE
jgi:hypothetical protein